MFCNNLTGKIISKRTDICICLTESLSCTPDTNIMLKVNDSPKQNNLKKYMSKQRKTKSLPKSPKLSLLYPDFQNLSFENILYLYAPFLFLPFIALEPSIIYIFKNLTAPTYAQPQNPSEVQF